MGRASGTRWRLPARERCERMLSNAEINKATPEELVVAFIPLARRYARKVYPHDPDAVQDACLALVEAARTYDPNRGSFKAWAMLYMRRTVKRGKSLRERIIHLPAAKVEQLSDVLLAKENKPPEENDDHEVAKRVGMKPKVVSDVLSMPQAVQSINNGHGDGDSFDIEALFPAEDSGELVINELDLAELLASDPELVERLREWADPPESADESEMIAYRKTLERRLASYLAESADEGRLAS